MTDVATTTRDAPEALRARDDFVAAADRIIDGLDPIGGDIDGERRAPGDVHTIDSFCKSNTISRSLFNSLKRQGRGPEEIELDGRTILTEEANQAWRKARAEETQARRAARAATAQAAVNSTDSTAA